MRCTNGEVISSPSLRCQVIPKFMSIAVGSASELEYQLLLVCDLRYNQDESYRELHAQIERFLTTKRVVCDYSRLSESVHLDL